MRIALKYVITGLLCLALLIPCACTSDQTSNSKPVESSTVETPDAQPSTEPSEASLPAESDAPQEADPMPTATGDVPALYPDEETKLSYHLDGEDLTIAALRHHTLHGYTIVYDAIHYEFRTYHEVDSYWSDTGLYLSVSIVYGMPTDYVLDGLQLQENIEMAAELTYIGAENYAAYTLYTEADGLYRQFWVLDYNDDTMLIEQSYPTDHEYVEFHRVIHMAMLDTLTLDNPPASTAENSALIAYTTALENLYYHWVLPDGSNVQPPASSLDSISDNRFAIYDIDNDGGDELIIEYTSTITAGMLLLIYDYDEETQSLRQQFCEFPLATFYDNGSIQAGISHNQGLAGAFWPYTLYQYDAAADSYVSVGLVDAWDKARKEADFPDDIDKDGDGIVYYLPSAPDTPVDAEEYSRWLSTYLDSTQTVAIPYQYLTGENIAELK